MPRARPDRGRFAAIQSRADYKALFWALPRRFHARTEPPARECRAYHSNGDYLAGTRRRAAVPQPTPMTLPTIGTVKSLTIGTKWMTATVAAVAATSRTATRRRVLPIIVRGRC